MQNYILFDFDGTLADSFDKMLELLHQIAGKYKLTIPPKEELKQLSLREIFKKASLSFFKRLLLVKEMKQLATKDMKDIKAFDGIETTLAALQGKGYHLYILTSNTRLNVEVFLKANNLQSYFEGIIDQASLFGKHRKIKKFLKEHRISKKQMVYVGDETRDIQAMDKVGVPMVAVSWGFDAKELLESASQHVANNPNELLQKCEDLFFEAAKSN